MVLFVFIYLIIQFACEATQIIGFGVTVQIVCFDTNQQEFLLFLTHPSINFQLHCVHSLCAFAEAKALAQAKVSVGTQSAQNLVTILQIRFHWNRTFLLE